MELFTGASPNAQSKGDAIAGMIRDLPADLQDALVALIANAAAALKKTQVPGGP